jgi:U3 small nucleolar ribonucleoprotein component
VHHITDSLLRDAIVQQDVEFDSHSILRWLYVNAQREYLEELYRNREAPRPFTETHRQIAQAVARLGNVEKVGTADSPTVWGDSTDNARWRKRV